LILKLWLKITNVDSPLEFDSINDDDPTIRIPRIAIPHPTKCLF